VCVYIYIYIYIYIYMFIHTDRHSYIYMSIFTYMATSYIIESCGACVYIYMCVYDVHVCIYASSLECSFIWMEMGL
jgi:hypothetical protein